MADEKRAREWLKQNHSQIWDEVMFVAQPSGKKLMLSDLLAQFAEFAESSKAKEGPPETGSVEYWKSRAETAELKVLTFHEEIAKEGQPAPPQEKSC